MRKTKQVDLGGGHIATVHEFTVQTVWRLWPVLKSDGDDIGLFNLLENKWPELLPVIMENIDIPEGIELGFGDVDALAAAFIEANQSFLDRAGGILGVDLTALAQRMTNSATTSAESVSP